MSSLVRNIQRSSKRSQRPFTPVPCFNGRGSKLGVRRPISDLVKEIQA